MEENQLPPVPPINQPVQPKKKKLSFILILLATIILAAIAITTAWKLYQRGLKPVAPSVPESKPKAQEEDLPENITPAAGCRICNLTGTPVPTATTTPLPTSTPPPTAPTNTPPPGATSTPRPTATPSLPTEAAATSTPRPTSTRVPTATKAPIAQKEPTPTEIELPKAGIKIPTLTGILGGLLLISLGVVFVF